MSVETPSTVPASGRTNLTFLTAVAAVTIPDSLVIRDFTAVMVQIEGITTATVTFQGTIDGVNWKSIRAVNTADGTIATTATADGIFLVPVGGLNQFRPNLTAWTSGTITVTGRAIEQGFGDSVSALTLGANSGVDIGDVDVTSLPALAAGTNSIGGTKDNGPHWTTAFGVSSAAVVSADITSAAAVTAAPTGTQKLVITDIIASSDTAMNILFEEETTGTDIFKVFIPANGTVQITPRGKIKLATADKKLTAKGSVAGNIGITVAYYSEV